MDSIVVEKDIILIIIFCAVMFVPLGFYIRDNFYRMKLFFRIAPNLRSNLKSKGTFRDYLNSGKN